MTHTRLLTAYGVIWRMTAYGGLTGHGPSRLAWSESWRPTGVKPHSSDEPSEHKNDLVTSR